MTVSITDIEGVSVGHASDFEGLTGVTVILTPSGMTGGVTISGFASSTRQIDALSPSHIVPEVHAICIAGGSAFGLDAASGVMSLTRIWAIWHAKRQLLERLLKAL